MANSHQSENRKTIFEAIAYFDVFEYPLTIDEILLYSKIEDIQELKAGLEYLLTSNLVYKLGDFYSISPNNEIAKLRLESEKRANLYTSQAKKKSKLIAKFPYVRAVFISGSLSKGVMPDDGDIDYFIITKTNRLWIARTLLILYKKLFLLNSRKYFCVNYFIGEDNLEIENKNRFTATEIITLMPMVNMELYNKFLEKNNWVDEFYIRRKQSSIQPLQLKKSFLKYCFEPILNLNVGNRVDNYFLKITLKKWYAKFGEMKEEDFKLAMKSTKNVSKHHPSNFQVKVLEMYSRRMDQLIEKSSIQGE